MLPDELLMRQIVAMRPSDYIMREIQARIYVTGEGMTRFFHAVSLMQQEYDADVVVIPPGEEHYYMCADWSLNRCHRTIWLWHGRAPTGFLEMACAH